MILATATQYEALAALVRCGTIKEASIDLDITRYAFDWRMRKLRNRTRLTNVQLAAEYGADRIQVELEFWRLVA